MMSCLAPGVGTPGYSRSPLRGCVGEPRMDQSPPVVTVRFNKFLPYWAVLQTDLRQTLRSWVYRLWVLMTVLAATGFLLYRVGLQTEAGIWQSAAGQTGDLFRV